MHDVGSVVANSNSHSITDDCGRLRSRQYLLAPGASRRRPQQAPPTCPAPLKSVTLPLAPLRGELRTPDAGEEVLALVFVLRVELQVRHVGVLFQFFREPMERPDVSVDVVLIFLILPAHADSDALR